MDIAWSILAYLAFAAIIAGVLFERFRNELLTGGAAVLALYSAFFLGDPVFAALQILITISGFLQLRGANQKGSAQIVVLCTILALSYLFMSGAIQTTITLIGAGGLLGIAFGITALPHRSGFWLMLFGGLLLIGYAHVVGAQVFFWLNIFFVFANARSLYKS